MADQSRLYGPSMPVAFGDSPSIDAFGRLRVGLPGSIFDIKQHHDKQPLLFDESITDNSGNAASTHSTADAATTMHVEANDSVIRQTRIRFHYQAGKSQLFLMTGVLGAGVEAVRRRVGAFDAGDGLFFELDGTTLSVVIRKGGSDTKWTQSEWNLDPLDGNGSSRKTIDTSKAQIFVIDYEWLGVGRVRFGFVIDGLIYYVHQALTANEGTAVYTSASNHPVRYEIVSTGGTADLVHICCSAISEGGSPALGIPRSFATGSTPLDANVADTIYACLGIRLKSTHLDASAIPSSLSVISETNDDFRWIVSLNPTIAETFTYNGVANSCIEAAAGATTNTVSDLGTILAQGYASVETKEIRQDFGPYLLLGSTIAGTADQLVLSIMPLSANADIQAAINWRELI